VNTRASGVVVHVTEQDPNEDRSAAAEITNMWVDLRPEPTIELVVHGSAVGV
jgi:intracellular sulfur oxidation DsrE/DsrF family protein